MILTDFQARMAARIAERSVDGQVSIDANDKRGIYPVVEMAIHPPPGEANIRPDGWKVYVVEPKTRATVRV